MKKRYTTFWGCLLAIGFAYAKTLPYKNVSLPPQQRADDLIARLTFEEKVSVKVSDVGPMEGVENVQMHIHNNADKDHKKVMVNIPATATAAQKRKKYEFMRNLPVYADSLIADLTYPMAWGNSKVKNFVKWKRMARQKVFDCMLMPPPPPADGYKAKVISEERRDG